jgi:hypothetical protein
MLETKIVEKIKHILSSITFFLERRGVYNTMRGPGGGGSTAGQSTDDNRVRRRKDAISMPDNQGKSMGTHS